MRLYANLWRYTEHKLAQLMICPEYPKEQENEGPAD